MNTEIRDVRLYIGRLLKNMNRQDPVMIQFYDWLQMNGAYIAIDLPGLKKKVRLRGDPFTEKGLDEMFYNKLIDELLADEDFKPKKGDIEKNLKAFARFLTLDKVETRILRFVLRTSMNDRLEDLCRTLVSTRLFDSEKIIARAIDEEIHLVRKKIKQSELITNSLLDRYSCSGRNDFTYKISDRVIQAFSTPFSGLDGILSVLLGKPLEANLVWDDYDYIARERDIVRHILARASKVGSRGINILFYGPPGTGKTELSKLIAAKINKKIFAVCEADEYGEEPSRSERLNNARLCQSILSRQKGALLLFDEMEDAIGCFNDRGSKIFLNRILEENPVPTIWIANRINHFDQAFLRRMTYAVEIKLPSASARKKQLVKLASAKNITLSQGDINEIAGTEPVSAAIMATAVNVSAASGGDARLLKEVTYSLRKVTNYGRIPKNTKAGSANFDLRLLNDGGDLAGIGSKIGPNMAHKDFSLCLYGPPGTGKSAYVRALAEKMEIEVLEKRASDILSMWVGESEQNIARAFEEASAENAFLIFDEVDSLLSDRRGADKSWEVTQVNEMLTWMENHPLPFACTTNLVEKIDQAALRRFTFKVKLGYLTREQAEIAFDLFFGIKAPADIRYLGRLTPGDYANVKKRLRFEDPDIDGVKILNFLEEECRLKSDKLNPIGFRAPEKIQKKRAEG